MSDSRHDDRRAGWEHNQPAARSDREAASSRSDDPLAELARLIDEDPFADFNRDRDGAGPGAVEPADWAVERDVPVEFEPLEEPADIPAEAPEIGFPDEENLAPSHEIAPAEPWLTEAEDQVWAAQDEPADEAVPEGDCQPDAAPIGYEEDPDHARLFADISQAYHRDAVEQEAEPAAAPATPRFDENHFEEFEARLFAAVDFDRTGDEPQPAFGSSLPAHDMYSDPVATSDWQPSAAAEASAGTGEAEPREPYADELERPVEAGEAAYGSETWHEDASHPAYAEASEQSGGAPRRGLFVVASLAGLVVFGGALAFGYRGFVADPESPPPVIRAETAPVKVAAESTSDEIEVQSKLVHDRIGGEGGDRETRLVSREEPVFDVAGRNGELRVIEPGQDVELRGGGDAAEADDSSATAYQPRRVRTVVVRPDGTIVSNPAPVETALASSETEIEIPAAPAASPNPQQQQQQGQPAANATPAATDASEPRVIATTPDGAAATQGAQEGTAGEPSGTGETASGVPIPAPPPQDRPARAQTAAAAPPAQTRTSDGRPMQLGPSGQRQVAQAAPTSEPATPSNTTTNAAFPVGSYVVQVASTRNESEARGAASAIEQRYGEQLSGYEPAVEMADLGDRGVFYRIAVGPIEEQSDASSLCERLKSAGLDCFVRRN